MDSASFYQEQKTKKQFNIFDVFRLHSRINRLEFLAILLNWHVFSCLVVIIGFLGFWPGYLGMALYLFPFFGAYLAAIKRMHDFNCSGWWLLFLLVPYIGLLIFSGLLFLYPGTQGNNRFGPQSVPTKKRYLLIFSAPITFLLLILTFYFLAKYVSSSFSFIG